jgi:diaminohydroxyphosphoribosylaminopyrimidine deaminase/5-amino-6-(5-phosphoribosylamino)uracil reductase
MQDDERWIRRALELAVRGRGQVHPNPMVGCVLVRGDKVVAEGYHHGFGKDHAEVDAIKKAGSRAKGTTLYANLEPCVHFGKTPPCVVAIAGSGIRRVVAAMRDPNPQVAGKGFAFLRKHGGRVTQGILQKEAAELNRAFITWVTQHRPYVTLKAAVSLDGKIATATGDSRWITTPAARARGHALRAEIDAIAVGAGTILKDNPALTAHGAGRNPRRVIFDSLLRIPLKSQVLKSGGQTMIMTTSRAPAARRRALERKGVAVYTIARDKAGLVSLPEALRVLAREGVAHLLVEGGGTLNASFLSTGLVDEAVWFIAPKIIGGAAAKTAVEGAGVAKVANAWGLKVVEIDAIGPDICIRGKMER